MAGPVKYKGVEEGKVRELLAKMTRNDAAKLFEVNPATITMWRNDLGLSKKTTRDNVRVQNKVDAALA